MYIMEAVYGVPSVIINMMAEVTISSSVFGMTNGLHLISQQLFALYLVKCWQIFARPGV